MAANDRIPCPSVFLLDVAGGNWMLHDFYALRLSPQLGQFQRGVVGGEATMVPRTCENRQETAGGLACIFFWGKIHQSFWRSLKTGPSRLAVSLLARFLEMRPKVLVLDSLMIVKMEFTYRVDSAVRTLSSSAAISEVLCS